MSFLFSSKDKPAVQKNAESMMIPSAIRTMQDDIEAIKNGTDETTFKETARGEASVPFVPNIPSKPLINLASKQENPFREYVEDGRQTENPFGVASKLEKSIPGVFLQATNTKSGVTPMVIEGGMVLNQPTEKRSIFIIGGMVIVILLLVSAGGYYYFFIAGKQITKFTVPEDIVQKYPPKVAEDIPKELPYALNKANYLSINTEVVSLVDIQKILLQVASQIKESSTTQPVEFLITDQNNNPIAFNRFAFLLKLEIIPDILALIDETFSLYVYNDAGNVRLGLDLKLKDQTAVLSAIPKIESTLPYAFRALILDQNVNIAKAIPFKSNTYSPRLRTMPGQDKASNKQIPLRYANIDVSHNWSIDYALANNHWYIGTSRNTLRTLLDTLVK